MKQSTHTLGGQWQQQRSQRGVTLLEVLVTILIVTFGLLGLAGLQARIQTAELESYQRVQALVLLQDMVDRLTANRKAAVQYVTTSTLVGSGLAVGTGSTVDCSAPTTSHMKDLCNWNSALLGSAEAEGSTKLGAMIGARGCISNPVTTMPYEFVVSVAWQGLTPTATPTASTCGQGQYGTNDAHRRVVSQRVIFACLQSTDDGITCAAATP